MLDWPDSEHWKVGTDQENGQQHVIELIHENETVEKWTEMGNMTSIKGVVNVPIDTAMRLMFKSAADDAINPKLTFIKKGETQGCSWIIFTIESASFKSDPHPESQVWFIVQGKQGLYTNFVALKKAKLPEDFKKKWSAFFQSMKLVYN